MIELKLVEIGELKESELNGDVQPDFRVNSINEVDPPMRWILFFDF
jgi:hypothetical protein